MTNEPQLNEPVPAPPPSVPLLMDDEWEAPPPGKGRLVMIAAFIGIALVVMCIELFRNRERMWEPEDESTWVPNATAPAPPAPAAPPALSRDSNLRVIGTMNHDPSEPSEAIEPPPSRSPRSPSPVGRGGQRVKHAGYLSINSTPWAELSVDGRVVGTTPQMRIRVTAGRHHLLLVRAGFQVRSAWVNVPAGGTVRLTDITLSEIAR